MAQDDNKKQNEAKSDTANIRQTNSQQNEQGEINMGGSEFSGDGTDIETSSSGLPTMNPDTTVPNSRQKNRDTKQRS